jgi:hypothetical protein
MIRLHLHLHLLYHHLLHSCLILGKFLATLMVAIPRQLERVEVVGCSSTTFFKHNSPVFDRRGKPMATDDWVASFEDLANALRCTDEQKVDYAGMKLIGEAKYW